MDTNLQIVIQDAMELLANMDEEAGSRAFRDGGWSRKQLLGHLIDSAVHNRVRLLAAVKDRTALEASYDQEVCVAMQGWGEMAWADLLRYWVMENDLLLRVAARAPDELVAAWRPGYEAHLRHHLAQL